MIGAKPMSRARGARVRRLLRRGSARSAHGLLGPLVGALLLVVAGTGLVLNHPVWLGVPRERTLAVAVDPADSRHVLRGTESGLFESFDGGVAWEEVETLLPLEHVVDIDFSPARRGEVLAVSRDLGVFRSADGGSVWEPVDIGFVPIVEGIRLERIALGSKGEIYLSTSGGLRSRDTNESSWRSLEAPTGRFRDFHAVVLRIHTGRILGPRFSLGADAAALGSVVLVVTGAMIWRRRAGRRDV
jgi:hypothetical protein